jgi:hypothetical protein
VSTAPLFSDFPPPGAESVDENTIMTDYWLSFVSVRRLDADSATVAADPRTNQAEFLRGGPSLRDRMKLNVLGTVLQKFF